VLFLIEKMVKFPNSLTASTRAKIKFYGKNISPGNRDRSLWKITGINFRRNLNKVRGEM
jgi:hypothetical protein